MTDMKWSDYGAAAAMSTFLAALTGHLVPWLIAMAAVIICDLVCGIRKSIIMNEKVRFSRACRDTMGKVVTYFAFVFMACAVNTAAEGDWHIDRWACLLVCFIEGCSIVSNILKPKGITIDLGQALAAVVKKLTNLDTKNIIKDDDNDES